jgi:hypothetical protein
LLDAIRSAESVAQQYQNYIPPPALKIDWQTIRKRALEFAKQASQGEACHSQKQFEEVWSNLFNTLDPIWVIGRNRIVPDEKLELSAEEWSLVRGMDNDYFAGNRKPAELMKLTCGAARPTFEEKLAKYMDTLQKGIQLVSSKFQQSRERAKKLAAGWIERESKLTKALTSQKQARVSLIDSLPYVVGGLCIFGLCVIGAVRIFGPAVQMEWVASGQVIQFASVIVLLVIISVLGLAQILEEKTVSTLLGGIAGYVLSQGVGRAAARAAERKLSPSLKVLTREQVKAGVLRILGRFADNLDKSETQKTADLVLKGSPEEIAAALSDYSESAGGNEVTKEELQRVESVGELVDAIYKSINQR